MWESAAESLDLEGSIYIQIFKNWTTRISPVSCFCLQLEKDERSDEESEVDEEEDGVDQDDCCWEKSRDTLNSKLSMLTSSCVLSNLTNHRSSVVHRIRKGQ